ncbi:MAG: site-specific DNA-methyltransferase [bacterium]
MKNQPTKVNLASANLSEEKLFELRRILPEAFSENKIDWEKLRTVLGDAVDAHIEKFGFTWAGKGNAIKNVLIPSKATLNPAPDESVMFDESQNLFIEGDNLEVLKLLQKAYFEKVKMIYIDPPYNTGGDFVYKDNFTAPLDNYLHQTGQKNGNGEHLTTNKETNGRFHSDWLSMMYPRLKLAWNLLRDDGVIFISIDDNEVHHLRILLNEVFGEENFIGEFIVVRAEGGGLAHQYVKGHDYLLAYAKSITDFEPLRRPKDIRGKIIEKDGKEYWIEEDWLRREFGKYGTLLYEDIEEVKGANKKAEIDAGLQSGEYQLIKKNGGHIVGRLRLIEEDGSKFYSILKHLSARGNDDLQELEMGKLFDFPKPVSLLRELILGATFFSKNDGDIILDFFAGSGTTAHAVMAQNAEDGGNRKWIAVQLPEKTESDSEAFKAGYKTIADLTKERIRRAAKKLENTDGFKIFKLAASNYPENAFEFDPDKTEDENKAAFEDYLKHAKRAKLIDDLDETSVIYENIVKEGFSLNSKIQEGVPGNNKVYTITDGDRQFSICLDRSIDDTTVKNITEWAKGATFICFDNALSDSQKANLGLHVELKTI